MSTGEVVMHVTITKGRLHELEKGYSGDIANLRKALDEFRNQLATARGDAVLEAIDYLSRHGMERFAQVQEWAKNGAPKDGLEK